MREPLLTVMWGDDMARGTRHPAQRVGGARGNHVDHVYRFNILGRTVKGLDNLHGYLKLGNFVVRLQFPFLKLPEAHPNFIARPAPPRAAIAAPPDDAPHEPPGLQRPPDDTPQAREPGTPSGRGHDPFFQ
jgi:hypothetical protein